MVKLLSVKYDLINKFNRIKNATVKILTCLLSVSKYQTLNSNLLVTKVTVIENDLLLGLVQCLTDARIGRKHLILSRLSCAQSSSMNMSDEY